MLPKILDLSSAIKQSQIYRKSGGKIILVGGCFDILHIGHIKFLEKAKESGGKLFVLLESDEKVRKLKGKNRPVFKQDDRAETLASLTDVDVIIKLPFFKSDEDYRLAVGGIRPDIIAVTENDPRMEKKKQQAEITGGKLKIVAYVNSLSSTRLAEILKKEKHY